MDNENEQQLINNKEILHKRFREIEELFDEQNQKLKELNERKKQLISENRKLESHVFYLGDENAVLVAQLEELSQKADEKKNEMEEKVQKLQRRIREMEDLFVSQNDEQNQKLKELNEEKNQLISENRKLESRVLNLGDENAVLMAQLEEVISKNTAARAAQEEFNRGIQRQADTSNVQSTPRPAVRNRASSFSRNEENEAFDQRNRVRRPILRSSSSNVLSTPRPTVRNRASSFSRNEENEAFDQRNRVRRPILRSSSTTPMSRAMYTISSSSKDASSYRKRGIMLDFTEDRKQLDFKVHKLSDNNAKRQIDHLKSHYDPSTGTFDQTYGETPLKAAKLTTPKKENKILNLILRR